MKLEELKESYTNLVKSYRSWAAKNKLDPLGHSVNYTLNFVNIYHNIIILYICQKEEKGFQIWT